MLLPKDPNDEKNVVLEIRAATGGDEASLFAAEVFRMYLRFAEQHRWKVEILSESETSVVYMYGVTAILHSFPTRRSSEQPRGEPLGSQPTLSRWENSPSPR